MTVQIITGDCRVVLAGLPEKSVHCCITSPPYFGLRDYGIASQIGLEPTPAAYVAELVAVFREVQRVLRDDGALWLNLGDSYAGYHGNKNAEMPTSATNGWTNGTNENARTSTANRGGLKQKDLIGIPWRVAFALQADGWYLRQDIIWSKPNPMPESVRDRCTKAHEYIFMLSKSARYYFDVDAIAEGAVAAGEDRGGGRKYAAAYANSEDGDERLRTKANLATIGARDTRNKRSVWTVATQPYSEAHFATFPPALIEPCIKAGTSEAGCCSACGAPMVRAVDRTPMQIDRSERTHELGRTRSSGTMKTPAQSVTTGWSPSCQCAAGVKPCTVLDCFGGAGTTGLVADRLQRNAILIELNPAYAAMARSRCDNDAPLFVETVA